MELIEKEHEGQERPKAPKRKRRVKPEGTWEEWRRNRRPSTTNQRTIQVRKGIPLPCGCDGSYVVQRGSKWYCANTPNREANLKHQLFPQRLQD